jgi:hypothetical protein
MAMALFLSSDDDGKVAEVTAEGVGFPAQEVFDLGIGEACGI